ncbi:MAG: hypothetical protein WBP23_04085 [Candidatus Saccharimonadales bacterium]
MPAEKKPIKVMDGVHPGDTPPASSSRPVIITNRPILATDPMLNIDGVDTSAEKPSGEPAVESSTRPKLTGKNIAPQERTEETDPPAPTSDEHNNVKSQNTAATDLPADGSTPPKEQNEVKTPSVNEESQAKPSTEGESEIATNTEFAEQTQKEEAEVDPKSAREIEIERHIAAGTYFVPIGQVKRRRRKVILLTMFILLAAILVLDLLLDMEILKLDFIPHTSFFK